MDSKDIKDRLKFEKILAMLVQHILPKVDEVSEPVIREEPKMEPLKFRSSTPKFKALRDKLEASVKPPDEVPVQTPTED